MGLELDKGKLIAHIKEMWEEKWDSRSNRGKELAKRPPREAYYEAYMDGARDLIDVVLTFDDDIRGVEAIAALQEAFQSGTS